MISLIFHDFWSKGEGRKKCPTPKKIMVYATGPKPVPQFPRDDHLLKTEFQISHSPLMYLIVYLYSVMQSDGNRLKNYPFCDRGYNFWTNDAIIIFKTPSSTYSCLWFISCRLMKSASFQTVPIWLHHTINENMNPDIFVLPNWFRTDHSILRSFS